MATVTKDIQEESEKITKVKRIIKKRTENLEKKRHSAYSSVKRYFMEGVAVLSSRKYSPHRNSIFRYWGF